MIIIMKTKQVLLAAVLSSSFHTSGWSKDDSNEQESAMTSQGSSLTKNSKSILSIIFLCILFLATSCKTGQVTLRPNEVPEVTHVDLKDFPKGEVLPMFDGWGGLAVDVNNAPQGTNFSPLLEGLENDLCQVPHWGYVVKGAVEIEYADGNKEIFKAGEAFYMKPGHTAVVLEDLQLVSFSPEEGMHDLSDHLEKKIVEMSKK